MTDNLGEQIAKLFFSSEIVDLSHLIAEDLPAAWPTHMPLQIRVWNWFAEQTDLHYVKTGIPFQTRWMTLDEHVGTHFDAPPHFIPPSDSGLPYANKWGDVYGDMIPLKQFMGPAAVIDCTALAGKAEPGASPLADLAFIKAWEASHGEFRSEDIVTFWSGWDKNYAKFPEGEKFGLHVIQGKSPGWVSPSVEVIEYLFDKGVRTLATDGASIGAAHDGIRTHVVGLSKGMVYIEGLANLGQLPPRGSFLVFLPLKIKNSSGAPGRAFAVVPK